MDERQSTMSSVVREYLSACKDAGPPYTVSVHELVDKSAAFPHRFPVKTVCCERLLKDKTVNINTLKQYINDSYPFLHESALVLLCEFLNFKKQHGSKVEKTVYKNMTLIDFVQRLLQKRAVVFHGTSDNYLLLNGTRGKGGWEKIGNDNEQPPLVLRDCLSYEEIKLSALLAVSCPSIFVTPKVITKQNENSCVKDLTTEPNGFVVGVPCPRLDKKNVMDWEDIMITEGQNTVINGYGEISNPHFSVKQIWSKFYNKKYLPTFEEVSSSSDLSNYAKLPRNVVFNTDIYRRRVMYLAQTLLLEVNERGKQVEKDAYIHIPLQDLNLSSQKKDIFVAAFADSCKLLDLNHISDIHFSCDENDISENLRNNTYYISAAKTKIKFSFSKRTCIANLNEENCNKLLVIMYPLNSNALPGNEYWDRLLESSSASELACCSQIAEFQNSHINRKISGSNLHIVSPHWGVLHISKYIEKRLNSSEPLALNEHISNGYQSQEKEIAEQVEETWQEMPTDFDNTVLNGDKGSVDGSGSITENRLEADSKIFGKSLENGKKGSRLERNDSINFDSDDTSSTLSSLKDSSGSDSVGHSGSKFTEDRSADKSDKYDQEARENQYLTEGTSVYIENYRDQRSNFEIEEGSDSWTKNIENKEDVALHTLTKTIGKESEMMRYKEIILIEKDSLENGLRNEVAENSNTNIKSETKPVTESHRLNSMDDSTVTIASCSEAEYHIDKQITNESEGTLVDIKHEEPPPPMQQQLVEDANVNNVNCTFRNNTTEEKQVIHSEEESESLNPAETSGSVSEVAVDELHSVDDETIPYSFQSSLKEHTRNTPEDYEHEQTGNEQECLIQSLDQSSKGAADGSKVTIATVADVHAEEPVNRNEPMSLRDGSQELEEKLTLREFLEVTRTEKSESVDDYEKEKMLKAENSLLLTENTEFVATEVEEIIVSEVLELPNENIMDKTLHEAVMREVESDLVELPKENIMDETMHAVEIRKGESNLVELPNENIKDKAVDEVVVHEVDSDVLEVPNENITENTIHEVVICKVETVDGQQIEIYYPDDANVVIRPALEVITEDINEDNTEIENNATELGSNVEANSHNAANGKDKRDGNETGNQNDDKIVSNQRKMQNDCCSVC